MTTVRTGTHNVKHCGATTRHTVDAGQYPEAHDEMTSRRSRASLAWMEPGESMNFKDIATGPRQGTQCAGYRAVERL